MSDPTDDWTWIPENCARCDNRDLRFHSVYGWFCPECGARGAWR